MRKGDDSITEDVILQNLPEDLALYSLWMPGDASTAAIQSTRVDDDSIQTWTETIELDDVFIACVEYLIRSGAPMFQDAKVLRKYTDALESQLRQGVPPRVARDAALRVVNQTTLPMSAN